MTPAPHNPPDAPRPVALVTGAGSGIGLAASLALARAGFDVALVGRRRDPLATAADAIARETPSASTFIRPADVSDPDAAAPIVRDVVDRFGRLDVLVNNAGLAPALAIDATTPAVLREVFNVNAVGPGALIAAAWPVFQRQHAGRVVNISTMGTADPFPGFFAYAAAKCAANSYARSIAREGAAHSIKGFAIAPGAVETAMFRALYDEAAVPRDRTLTPDAVARVIVECALGARDAQNGETIFLPSPA